MAMKQTQTKLFDFSDVGLDFCVGSKNLFPDRFKKMLSLGYNEQTVSSVAIAGNQVTLTYGGAHGYAQDRVLKVDSGTLASINDGEFWIDSVTTNTVTFTLDDAPTSVASGFTTRIAPLGWELVYEQANIHVYKFKHIDDTDMFLRLCFQNTSNRRNHVTPCVGNNYDSETGFITDENSWSSVRGVASPQYIQWEFGGQATTIHNDYSYTQGYSSYGLAKMVGSKYHCVFMTNAFSSTYSGRINGILPISTLAYEQLNRPLLIAESYQSLTGQGHSNQGVNALASVGSRRVTFSPYFADSMLINAPVNTSSGSSFLPNEIDALQTTTAMPIPIYLFNERHQVGYVAAGLYLCSYSSSNAPSTAVTASPSLTKDIDLNNDCVLHYLSRGNGSGLQAYFIAPVEEVKYV